jgi:hypothetical protein
VYHFKSIWNSSAEILRIVNNKFSDELQKNTCPVIKSMDIAMFAINTYENIANCSFDSLLTDINNIVMLASIRPFIYTYAMDKVIYKNDTNLIKILHEEHDVEVPDDIFDMVENDVNLDTIKYVMSVIKTSKTTSHKYHRQDLELIKYMRSCGHSWYLDNYEEIDREYARSLSYLLSAHELGIMPCKNFLLDAMKSDDAHIILFCYENNLLIKDDLDEYLASIGKIAKLMFRGIYT